LETWERLLDYWTENMGMHEYKPGDMVPVSSPLYRVVHDPPKEGVQLRMFYCDKRFPPCPECGEKVRYVFLGRFRKKEA
jgi:hypothetical protein